MTNEQSVQVLLDQITQSFGEFQARQDNKTSMLFATLTLFGIIVSGVNVVKFGTNQEVSPPGGDGYDTRQNLPLYPSEN